MKVSDLDALPPLRARVLGRFVVFGMVVALVVTVLTARLFYLQIRGGTPYPAANDSQRIVLQAVPSARGFIYDRAGRLLASNVPSYTVKILPADLPYAERNAIVARLSMLLGLSTTAINQAIDGTSASRFDLVTIATGVPGDVAGLISEDNFELPGVEVVVEARRQYPDGPLVSQLVGYTGAVTAADLQQLKGSGYQPDDTIGKAGLELQYESVLRGTYGLEQVERDATGQKVGLPSQVQAPQPGDSLQLTIDTTIQQQAQQALIWGMQAAHLTSGVVIVMNPQTGEILAMVSLPTYDDNLFAEGISNADFNKLITNPNQPLLNHAISEQYAPGSTYKLVTGSGALADGKITDHTLVPTYPYLRIGASTYDDWNHRGFGPLNIYTGFGNSSDTFFYQLAGMLGIDRLAYWAHQWGFGELSGVDLPGEVPGIVPSNAWKEDTLGQPIYPGETYLSGIGQSYDAVTPLQLINAYAALANGGTLYEPTIVHSILGPDGAVVRDFKPTVRAQVGMSQAVLREMRVAARTVVTIRHTYNLVDLPIVVAGKSGTAEFGAPSASSPVPYHTWFVAFVPQDPSKTASDPGGFQAVSRTDSNLIVLAFAYHSDTIGNAATEIVKYFLQLHYNIAHDYRLPELLRLNGLYSN